MPDKFSLQIEKGSNGLWFVTSRDIRGLLVAERELRTALAYMPMAIADLRAAAEGK